MKVCNRISNGSHDPLRLEEMFISRLRCDHMSKHGACAGVAPMTSAFGTLSKHQEQLSHENKAMDS